MADIGEIVGPIIMVSLMLVVLVLGFDFLLSLFTSFTPDMDTPVENQSQQVTNNSTSPQNVSSNTTQPFVAQKAR
jgi:hypothetical protein